MTSINPTRKRIPGQNQSKNHRIPRPTTNTPTDIAPHSPPPDPGGPKQASCLSFSAYRVSVLTPLCPHCSSTLGTEFHVFAQFLSTFRAIQLRAPLNDCSHEFVHITDSLQCFSLLDSILQAWASSLMVRNSCFHSSVSVDIFLWHIIFALGCHVCDSNVRMSCE